MRDGFGFIIFIGIIFLGWLMWSSKSDKEVFLFYFWALMIGLGILSTIYEFIKRL